MIKTHKESDSRTQNLCQLKGNDKIVEIRFNFAATFIKAESHFCLLFLFLAEAVVDQPAGDCFKVGSMKEEFQPVPNDYYKTSSIIIVKEAFDFKVLPLFVSQFEQDGKAPFTPEWKGSKSKKLLDNGQHRPYSSEWRVVQGSRGDHGLLLQNAAEYYAISSKLEYPVTPDGTKPLILQ